MARDVGSNALLSVVAPVYNEVEVVEEFLVELLESIKDCDFPGGFHGAARVDVPRTTSAGAPRVPRRTPVRFPYVTPGHRRAARRHRGAGPHFSANAGPTWSR